MDKVISPYIGIGLQQKEVPAPRGRPLKVKGPIDPKDDLEKILVKFCEIYDVRYEDVIGKSKRGDYVYIRQFFCYYVRNNFSTYGHKLISKFLGHVDHTTSMYSVKSFRERLRQNYKLPLLLKSKETGSINDYLNSENILFTIKEHLSYYGKNSK